MRSRMSQAVARRLAPGALGRSINIQANAALSWRFLCRDPDHVKSRRPGGMVDGFIKLLAERRFTSVDSRLPICAIDADRWLTIQASTTGSDR